MDYTPDTTPPGSFLNDSQSEPVPTPWTRIPCLRDARNNELKKTLALEMRATD
jgi:hypothetical protein